MPIIEAMACGVPVITSNLTSMPEIVGKAGYLVDPYSIEEIAAAFRLVGCDNRLCADLIRQGEKRVSDFSWEKSAREYLQVYQDSLF